MTKQSTQEFTKDIVTEDTSAIKWEPWIQTFTGRKFHYLSGPIEEVDIKDVAIALSRVPRWAGHTNHFYSVAQHSVWVSKRVEEAGGSKDLCLLGLLHDATEAYMLDLPSPLKVMIPEFKDFENKVWKKISRYFFGEVRAITEEIKIADRMALSTEARDLFSFPPLDDWVTKKYRGVNVLPDAHPNQIHAVGPVAAHTMFLKRYEELT